MVCPAMGYFFASETFQQVCLLPTRSHMQPDLEKPGTNMQPSTLLETFSVPRGQSQESIIISLTCYFMLGQYFTI